VGRFPLQSMRAWRITTNQVDAAVAAAEEAVGRRLQL